MLVLELKVLILNISNLYRFDSLATVNEFVGYTTWIDIKQRSEGIEDM